MKKSKILLGLGLMFTGFYAHAQNGLERLIVEKYYVSNAADSAASTGVLPVGSVTYRLYVDMRPGYKFQAAYGNIPHPLKIATSTAFFNEENFGATTPNGITVAHTKSGTVILDSWLSVGATATGKLGVPKTRDTDGSIVSTSTILKNNDPSAGIPISTQDGMLPGTPESVTLVGLATADLAAFDVPSMSTNLFQTTNGSWAALNGAVGADTANVVLIGQVTTNGDLSFELNIQLGTPVAGVSENYVARNPTGSEILAPTLLRIVNQAPNVSISAPLNNAHFITGDVVAITAAATDADGTVASVEFFVDGVSIGIKNAAPFTINYTSTAGTHSLTARATDNLGAQKTSAAVSIIVGNNIPPTDSIVAPLNNANFVTGDVVTINASAHDLDGTVASVEFFVDGVSIGLKNAAPYTINWTSVLGTHTLTAKATDNKGASTTSAPVVVKVVANIPPVVSVTAPINGATFTFPVTVPITAAARDTDGVVTQVEFFVNGVSIGVKTASPYAINWTGVIGTANITAKATDNKGAVTTSAVISISVADPNALPYKADQQINTCLVSSFCLPIIAVDSVKNVIGYDVVVHYNALKVKPTGNVTLLGDLINPAFANFASSIDTVNSLVNVSLFLNSSAPGNTFFKGKGKVFCLEFVKTANFHSVDTAKFTVPSLQESYYTSVVTKLVQAGSYITYKDSTFNGALKFWADNSALAYNPANPNQFLITNIYGNNASCSSKSAVAVQPDLAGNFAYDILRGVDVDIERDILNTTDVQPVINGLDAQLTRRVLVNDRTYTPTVYEMVAMDVNMDGVVSAGDVSQIYQRAVLGIPEFKQAWNYSNAGISNGKPSKDWSFIDSKTVSTNPAYTKSATFPANDGVGYSKTKVPVIPFCLSVPVTNLTDCPQIGLETYKGILVGDVDGNFKTVGSGGIFRPSFNPNKDRVIFDLSTAKVNGSTIDIPVSVACTTDSIVAMDFHLMFNESILTFDSLINCSLDKDLQSQAYLNPVDQKLRFTSSSLNHYLLNSPIAYLRFTMHGPAINASDLDSLKSWLNGSAAGVLVIDSPTGIQNLSAGNEVKIYPNPASDIIHVEVSEIADIQLTDVEGRVVFAKTNAAANQKLEISTAGLANGMYLMKVSNSSFVAVKKVVVNNK
jgi:hypothetical protein